MYSYRGHWIIKTENNNKNKSIALASLLQFGFFHGGFIPGVTGCDSSTVGAAASGVRSYLTQGKLPVPAALTSHPLQTRLSSSPSSSSLTCNFPGETTSYSQLAEAVVRIGIWSCSCWSTGMEGRGDISAWPFPSLSDQQRITLHRQAFWQGISPNPFPAQQLRRSHSGSPQGPGPDCAIVQLCPKAAGSGIQRKKVARN